MIQYLIACALCIACTSCNLDIEPENGLTYTNSFNTETELNATTSSIQFFINSAVPENQVFITAGIKADELKEGEQVRQWNPKSVIDVQDWKGLYDLVFECNLLLDNIHRTAGLSQERRNFHVGQAEFGLGLAYLVLVQRYGDVPIPIDSKTIAAYGTSPQMQVINTAIEHAQKAFDILPIYGQLKDINGNIIVNKQYASKGACAALLAHLYAWKGSVIDLYKLKGDAQEAYRKSVEYASMIISRQVGPYQLCTNPEELCTYLSDPSRVNPEAIFTIVYDINRSTYAVTPNRIASQFVSWPVKETSLLGDIVSETGFRIYKSTVKGMYSSDDLRLKAFFYKIDSLHVVDNHDYALLYKFRKSVYDADQYAPSGKSFRSLNADYVYWRLADIYLLRAECNAKLGNKSQAIADLNIIRSRAQAPLFGASTETDDLAKVIFREREKEFIGETDTRYFDIIRNNYISTELQGKFRMLTRQDIINGALVLPVPQSAMKEKDGKVINTVIRQKAYWLPFM